MADTWLFKLKPTSSWHVGERGHLEDCDYILHSDTLFGALVAVGLETGKSKWIDHREEIQVTSVFPLMRNTRFFPRPFIKFNPSGEKDEETQHKKLKKVSFVSEKVFCKILECDVIQYRTKTGFLFSPEEEKDFVVPCKTEIVPANILDRITSAAEPYRRGTLRFNTREGCGAWFLLKSPPNDFEELKVCIEHLGNVGLGGERSSGYGSFKLLNQPEKLPREDSKGTHFVTFSLYSPEKKEIEQGLLDSDHAGYKMLNRGGWITSPGNRELRKRNLRMFIEGSVFKGKPGNNWGSIRDVAPRELSDIHPVWRDGRAWAIYFTPKEES